MNSRGFGLAIVVMAALLVSGCTSFGGDSGTATGFSGGSGTLTKGPEATLVAALDHLTNDSVRGMGWTVSTSGDGQTFLATRPYIKGTGKSGPYSLGAAWVFENGDVENSSANFYDADDTSMLYGGGGAISSDGSFVVVGAPGLGANQSNMVYGYARKSSSWQQGGKPVDDFPSTFTLRGAKGASFGFSLALSAKGKTVVVGAPTENGIGLVHYYLAPTGGWRSLKTADTITAGQLGAGKPSQGAEFGHSVAISRDDSVIVVGAPGDQGDRGAVYVFQKPQKGWPATETLLKVNLADAKPGDRFGESVSISQDGSMIAVGADGVNAGAGKVYCVKYDWLAGTLTTVPISDSKAPRGSGLSVAISADGRTIAAGNMGVAKGGGVCIYRTASGDWTDAKDIDDLTPTAGAKDMLGGFMGFSVALVDDGSSVLMGVPGYKLGSGRFYWIKIDK